MRIDLQNPHGVIRRLVAADLPNFAVLIGRNGAGKTHLLAALKAGNAVVHGTATHEIDFFDMASFSPADNVEVHGRQTNTFAKATSDAFLLGPPGGRPPIETATEIFDRFADEVERTAGVRKRDELVRDIKDAIGNTPAFGQFPRNGLGQGNAYGHAVWAEVISPLMNLQAQRRANRRGTQPSPPPNSCNGDHSLLLTLAMKLTRKLPHELTHEDIVRASRYEGEILANTISEVFAAYKVDQFVWAHKRVETEAIPYTELIAEYERTHAPPWNILREVLWNMRQAAGDTGLFDFEFSDPGDYRLDMNNYERFSFKAEMTNRANGARYELHSLSSGEKVLMTLCLMAFNQYLGRRRPRLLLLDELDAVLHPSMVAALVETLKSLFVRQGTKVLLTSPTAMTPSHG